MDIQIKMLKQYVGYNPKWKLYDIYTDKDLGGDVARPGRYYRVGETLVISIRMIITAQLREVYHVCLKS